LHQLLLMVEGCRECCARIITRAIDNRRERYAMKK
jgi:hypothetical protein